MMMEQKEKMQNSTYRNKPANLKRAANVLGNDPFAEESGLNCAGNDGLVHVADDDLFAGPLGLFEGFGQTTVEDREVTLVVDKFPGLVAMVWCCTSVGAAESVFVPLEETIYPLCVRQPVVGVEDNALFIVVLDGVIRDGTFCYLDVKLESESQHVFFFRRHVGGKLRLLLGTVAEVPQG